jgi:hypothetical protein
VVARIDRLGDERHAAAAHPDEALVGPQYQAHQRGEERCQKGEPIYLGPEGDEEAPHGLVAREPPGAQHRQHERDVDGALPIEAEPGVDEQAGEAVEERVDGVVEQSNAAREESRRQLERGQAQMHAQGDLGDGLRLHEFVQQRAGPTHVGQRLGRLLAPQRGQRVPLSLAHRPAAR